MMSRIIGVYLVDQLGPGQAGLAPTLRSLAIETFEWRRGMHSAERLWELVLESLEWTARRKAMLEKERRRERARELFRQQHTLPSSDE